MISNELCESAAMAIQEGAGLVITSGAGMGVDSGLPDFRGDRGFWKAYPMYERLGINFVGAANPVHFKRDPEFGWGFYGHRTNLYRETVPHEGFGILLDWVKRFDLEPFVVTSNVDGQFQKAGFSDKRILEVHGSIHHLQCLIPCSKEIWKNDGDIQVDLERMRALSSPVCKNCGGVARPNILMFGDFSWLGERTGEQQDRFQDFLNDHGGGALVVIELGAGTAIPTIRHLSEQLVARYNGRLIRINPREHQVPTDQFALGCNALEGLQELDRRLQ